MRIDSQLPSITTTEPRDAKATSRTPAATNSPSSSSVVQLSSAGAAVSAAPAKHDTTARIQTIRAQLEKGEYPVDLDRLASRIVDDEVLREGK